MAPPIKKREVDAEASSGSDDGNSEGEDMPDQEMINVDFEGRSPIDSDFHGIKQLLQQLFLKAHLNLTELTEQIIGQNYVGSVVKQSCDDEEEEDDDDDDPNDVFGVTTVINLSDKQSLECITQLRTLLTEVSREHGTEQSATLVDSLLSDKSKSIGLIINERFINIPAQISVPLMESLRSEIEKAHKKNGKFEFTHYLFICKLYKLDVKAGGRSKKKGKDDTAEIIWSNPEEEIIDKEAICRFEFCVKDESDSGLGGGWTEDDEAMIPYRRILIVPSEKFPALIDTIKASLQ